MAALASNVPPRDGSVEVNLVGERKMAGLNRIYRGGGGATAILTFSYGESSGRDEDPLGEIYICWARLSLEARKHGVSRKAFLLRLVTHGLCHLLGYSHGDEKCETAMEEVELELLRPYLSAGEMKRLFG